MTNVFLKLGLKTARKYLNNLAGPNYRRGGKDIERAWSKIYGVTPTTLRAMAKDRLSLPAYQNRLRTKQAIGEPIQSWDYNIKRIDAIRKKDWPLSATERGGRADRSIGEAMDRLIWKMNR